jgi:hypothetical protein
LTVLKKGKFPNPILWQRYLQAATGKPPLFLHLLNLANGAFLVQLVLQMEQG